MDCVAENCNQPRSANNLCEIHYVSQTAIDKRSNEDTFIRSDAFSDALELADLAREQGPVPCENAPDLYYPEQEIVRGYARNSSLGNFAILKEMCNKQCPIRNECLEYALKHNERYGIWGGMTAPERKKLKQGIKPRVYKAA